MKCLDILKQYVTYVNTERMSIMDHNANTNLKNVLVINYAVNNA